MTRLSAQTVVIDRFGNQIQLPLPQQYYQLKQDSDNLTQQKVQLAQQQAGIAGKMKDVQAEIPVPKFTGFSRSSESMAHRCGMGRSNGLGASCNDESNQAN